MKDDKLIGIGHNDCWNNNMIFKEEASDNGNEAKWTVKLIDFQNMGERHIGKA